YCDQPASFRQHVRNAFRNSKQTIWIHTVSYEKGVDAPSDKMDDSLRLDEPTLRRLGWFLWTLALLLGLAAFVLTYLVGFGIYEGLGFRSFAPVGGLIFTSVGLVLIVHHPRHAIGWVLCITGVLIAAQGLILELALYAQIVSERFSLAHHLFWILEWYWQFFLYGLLLLLLLFPNGRLPSRRWRPILVLITITVPVRIGLLALKPGPLAVGPDFTNPYGLDGLSQATQDLLGLAGTVLLLLAFVPAASALFLRFHRARGVERQQLKWFAYVGVMVALLIGPATRFLWLLPVAWLGLLAMPVTIGIAVMRYRLYDIDLIIRRTLVYGILSAVLVAVYFGSVILLQAALTALTGQQSPVAIVISTLFIAALFNPLRQRVQAIIDRRLYRRKYDADRMLTRFAATARDEVDLDQLTSALLDVVNETVQPRQMSLWLKTSSDGE
ncbi:MAG: hypothetical protein R3300_22450, partial [Candidatus Promineifilaceae bacterium]|nr:hypothetical protein [Candidatus Promineifilaceae bacterium]